MWRPTWVVVVLMLAGCLAGSDAAPEQDAHALPAPETPALAAEAPPVPAPMNPPLVSARAVEIMTSVRPEGASAAFVWELPADFVSPALVRPEGHYVFLEGAILPPEGLTSWALYIFDLSDAATPISVVTSPTMTAVDGFGSSGELGPSERPFYFHLGPGHVSEGRFGLWLSGQGAPGELGMVVRVLDHDPGFLYVGPDLVEPPAADLAGLLARVGAAPEKLPAHGEFGAWDLEIMFELDSVPDSSRWQTPGIEATRGPPGAVEASTHEAAFASRNGWADAMAGIVRVAGVDHWNVEATVQGESEQVSRVAPFTGAREEWQFMRSSHQGEGPTSLATMVTGATAPGVRRSVFSLWSSEGTMEAAFGVPFAAREDGAPGFGQGLGADGALRVQSAAGPVLAIPDAGRGIGVNVPTPDKETEARAADRPEIDLRPQLVHEETVTVHLAFNAYTDGSHTGRNNENCLPIDLANSRLLGVSATATWTPSGANPDKLSLVALSEPYHGLDAAYGPSPLTLDYSGGEIPRSSKVWITVQSMDTRREDIPVAVVVEQDVTLNLTMKYQGSTPALGAASSCVASWM